MKAPCWLLFCLFILAACNSDPQPQSTGQATALAESASRVTALPVLQTPTPSTTPSPTAGSPPAATLPAPPPSLTTLPTDQPTPTPTATGTATATPSPTPIGRCDDRNPADGLFELVSDTYGLSRTYEPSDLVQLSDYFENEITLGYPTQARAIVIEPLQNLVAAMHADGLMPWIISGYRSYAAQAVAYAKWADQYDYVGGISAEPGHSEHQLGTTIDFGSPNLAALTGDPDLQFHTYFYMTPEGEWLATNAHLFGFTLSYPRDAFEETGFYFEPWHYRYVTVPVATDLHETGTPFSTYRLAQEGPPCIP